MTSHRTACIILLPSTKCSRTRESLRIHPFVCTLYAYARNRLRTVKIKSCTKVAQALFVSLFPSPLNRSAFPKSLAFQSLFPPALMKKNTRS